MGNNDCSQMAAVALLSKLHEDLRNTVGQSESGGGLTGDEPVCILLVSLWSADQDRCFGKNCFFAGTNHLN